MAFSLANLTIFQPVHRTSQDPNESQMFRISISLNFQACVGSVVCHRTIVSNIHSFYSCIWPQVNIYQQLAQQSIFIMMISQSEYPKDNTLEIILCKCHCTT
jgi:hypothetical protein